MKHTAALILLALVLTACAGPGGPALRHAATVDENPYFRDCVSVVQVSAAGSAAESRADVLNRCLDYPQVADRDAL